MLLVTELKRIKTTINRPKYFFIGVAVLLCIILASCEYEPHIIYERELDKNATAPQIEVVDLDLSLDKDTIELIYNRVYFHFKSSNQAVRWVKFYINDSLIGTAESGNGYFDMHYDFLYEGLNKLRLELITYSGTGSIAEGLGAEGFVFSSKEWYIKVNNTVYINVTSTESDGFLKLRWPEPYSGIKEYIIYRSDREIGRTSTYEFIDKGYVGEGAEYKVKYINPTNRELSELGMVRIPNEIRIKYEYDTKNNYTIAWDKPRYYAAVDSIIVISSEARSYYQPDIEKTTDINRTGFKIPESLFGQLRQFQMVLIPKYPNPLYNSSFNPYLVFSSPKLECMIGYPSPIFTHFNRISNTEFIYHTYLYDYSGTTHNDSMFRYSTTENRILDRYRYDPPKYASEDHYYNPTTSPDGSYFSAVAGFTQTAIVNSPYSFKDYRIIDISAMTSNILKITISNSGTGLVIGYDKKYLYDFKNNSLLGFVNSPASLSDYNISPDGKYFFFSVSHTIWLYSYINSTITLDKTLYSWDTDGLYDYFNFMANDPGKVVSWSKDSKTFNILSCPEMEILKSFKVSEDKILDIDYSTNRILSASFDAKLLVVRSLTDGSVQYSIPVGSSGIALNNCFLSGNSIFQQNGARYFLN